MKHSHLNPYALVCSHYRLLICSVCSVEFCSFHNFHSKLHNQLVSELNNFSYFQILCYIQVHLYKETHKCTYMYSITCRYTCVFLCTQKILKLFFFQVMWHSPQ